jgi:hypothetical protein
MGEPRKSSTGGACGLYERRRHNPSLRRMSTGNEWESKNDYAHRRLPPDRRLPLRSQVVLPFASQSLRPRLKYRPHRVGRHQKRKTSLLYVARIAHRHLSIAPRGLDRTSIRKRHYWIGFRSRTDCTLFIVSYFRHSALHI